MAQYPQTVIVNTTASRTTLNVISPIVVFAGAGWVTAVNVVTAGSAAGTINDAATTGAAAVGNQVATAPNTVGRYPIEMPVTNGLVIIPGAAQVLAISWRRP